MTDLAALMNQMISDVRTGRVKPVAKKKSAPKTAAETSRLKAKRLADLLGKETHGPLPTPITSAWTDEAIVLIIHRTVCSCGHTHTAPQPHLHIRRFKEVKARKSGLHTTPPRVDYDYYRVATPNIYTVYSGLRRATETYETHVDNCHICFQAEVNNKVPFQVSLQFPMPPTQSIIDNLKEALA